ncbi:hypothetical protein [Pseudomonas asplenii]|uniref:hypothetical protein n=1 Tax=Pseudomonas asplenii TaxID=53407 RepID=UPI001EFB96D6|nr:hypothetical protein [Pseudomonas fuscovaginae]
MFFLRGPEAPYQQAAQVEIAEQRFAVGQYGSQQVDPTGFGIAAGAQVLGFVAVRHPRGFRDIEKISSYSSGDWGLEVRKGTGGVGEF